MKNKFLLIAVSFLVLSSTACSGLNALSGRNKNDVNEWIAKKNLEQANEDKLAKDRQTERDRKIETEQRNFYLTHPEMPIPKMPLDSKSSVDNAFRNALNNFGFVTRYPGSQDPNQVYVKVGGSMLTMLRVQLALSAYGEECRRASAYTGHDYKNECLASLTRDISAFSEMLKNDDIPDKTKLAALGEASYANNIDFGYAARLAKMHFKLCQQRGNQGYVEMVTVAVPCNGQSDVLNIYAARKMGFL